MAALRRLEEGLLRGRPGSAAAPRSRGGVDVAGLDWAAATARRLEASGSRAEAFRSAAASREEQHQIRAETAAANLRRARLERSLSMAERRQRASDERSQARDTACREASMRQA